MSDIRCVLSHYTGETYPSSMALLAVKDKCLCLVCARFTPQDRDGNCPIANALYALNVEHNLTTPVAQCSQFNPNPPKKEGR